MLGAVTSCRPLLRRGSGGLRCLGLAPCNALIPQAGHGGGHKLRELLRYSEGMSTRWAANDNFGTALQTEEALTLTWTQIVHYLPSIDDGTKASGAPFQCLCTVCRRGCVPSS